MDDFNIGGDEGLWSWILTIIICSIAFGLILAIAFGYEYMKYSPLPSISFLTAVLYAMYKTEIPENLYNKYWPFLPGLKWFTCIVAIVLLVALSMKVLGI